ncbi:DUF4870 domain-containing protein [Glaciibacter psychrotolerans]|uniref:DUF4870 domain-containing protein n=1 Tax=Glaciibacter psychrotolerans TaxID=670054 RepID=A0A7Z0EC36_9MICO|nr:DUF4870 domain-containing protein [Leifsonia psychrotolerans]NYJ18864.1 hypothetical protein [Leifsonia psychrotolerans]
MSDSQAPLPDDPHLGQHPPEHPTQPAAPVAAPLTQAQDWQWASLAHLGGILSFLPSLIIWLVFKDRGRFTDEQAKEALNFQITLVFAYAIIWIVTGFLTVVTLGIGAVVGLLVWVVWIASVIFSILGFMQAKDGHPYRYPFAVRLIK